MESFQIQACTSSFLGIYVRNLFKVYYVISTKETSWEYLQTSAEQFNDVCVCPRSNYSHVRRPMPSIGTI